MSSGKRCRHHAPRPSTHPPLPSLSAMLSTVMLLRALTQSLSFVFFHPRPSYLFHSFLSLLSSVLFCLSSVTSFMLLLLRVLHSRLIHLPLPTLFLCPYYLSSHPLPPSLSLSLFAMPACATSLTHLVSLLNFSLLLFPSSFTASTSLLLIFPVLISSFFPSPLSPPCYS